MKQSSDLLMDVVNTRCGRDLVNIVVEFFGDKFSVKSRQIIDLTIFPLIRQRFSYLDALTKINIVSHQWVDEYHWITEDGTTWSIFDSQKLDMGSGGEDKKLVEKWIEYVILLWESKFQSNFWN